MEIVEKLYANQPLFGEVTKEKDKKLETNQNFFGVIKTCHISEIPLVSFSETLQNQSHPNVTNLFDLASNNSKYISSSSMLIRAISRKNYTKRFYLAIQIERTKSDNYSENLLKQFKDAERLIIQHIMNILSIKLKTILLKYENKKQIHNMNSLICLVSDILIERTYSGIYDCIKKWMPILTDYSGSSIIFYDPIGLLN